jgi:hypothetical protein
MTAYLPDNQHKTQEQILADFVLGLPPHDIDSVRFGLENGLLVLEGRVASYEVKRKIEAAAYSAGFQVQNGLRVTPGRIAAFPPPPLTDTPPTT